MGNSSVHHTWLSTSSGMVSNLSLNEQSYELEEYDEQLVRRLIEKVTVHDDRIEVEFKSGISIDVEN